jgi:acetyltransferase-like isoleucine patch superfamily enzyme
MTELLKNPLTLWLRWLLTCAYYGLKYFAKGVSIEYMAEISNTRFEGNNKVYKYARLRDVELGKYSYISRGTQAYHAQVGRFTCIGPEVVIGPGEHPVRNYVSSHPAFYSTLAQAGITFSDQDYVEEIPHTSIGHNVWIGTRAVVRAGVRIGDGAVIAAGAVVVSDVEPYTIVGGVPAKLIRPRFEPSELEVIQQTDWWNWSEEKLRANTPLFRDTSAFVKQFSKS